MIFGMFWRQFKGSIILTVVLYMIESLFRLAFSVLLNILFETVLNLNDNNLPTAYLLAFFTGFIWLLGQIARHNAFYEVPIIVGKVRSCLLTLLFKKLTKLSQYKVKSQ